MNILLAEHAPMHSQQPSQSLLSTIMLTFVIIHTPLRRKTTDKRLLIQSYFDCDYLSVQIMLMNNYSNNSEEVYSENK